MNVEEFKKSLPKIRAYEEEDKVTSINVLEGAMRIIHHFMAMHKV